jgi:hypothetical protein
MLRLLTAMLAAWLLVALPARASADVISFETRADGLTPFLEGDDVGAEFADLGITFANALVATPSLNTLLFDGETPAYSGSNLVIDNGAPISLTFGAPIVAFSGYFTYFAPFTLQAFDLADMPLAPISSLFGANYTSSGNAPDELLSIAYAAGISRVLLTGDPNGFSFTLDNVSFTPAADLPAPNPVPEPATISLLAIGGLGLLAKRLRA